MNAGTDPTNPDAWPKPELSSGARYVFAGLPLGQKVYARVAVVRRRGGQGLWSGLMEITVRRGAPRAARSPRIRAALCALILGEG